MKNRDCLFLRGLIRSVGAVLVLFLISGGQESFAISSQERDRNAAVASAAFYERARNLYFCYLTPNAADFCVSLARLNRAYSEHALQMTSETHESVVWLSRNVNRLLTKDTVFKQFTVENLALGCLNTEDGPIKIVLGEGIHGPTANINAKCPENQPSGISVGLHEGIHFTRQISLSLAASYQQAYLDCKSGGGNKRSSKPPTSFDQRGTLMKRSDFQVAVGKVWAEIIKITGNEGKQDAYTGPGANGTRGDCVHEESCGGGSSCADQAAAQVQADIMGRFHYTGCNKNSTPTPESNGGCYGGPLKPNLNAKDLAQIREDFCKFRGGIVQAEGQSMVCKPMQKAPSKFVGTDPCRDPRAMCALEQTSNYLVDIVRAPDMGLPIGGGNPMPYLNTRIR